VYSWGRLQVAAADTLGQYTSIGKVRSSVECWHSLATYLSLIDLTLQPDTACALLSPTARVQASAVPATAAVIAVPAGASTINITIKVGEA
jgi:hypothetical protein